MKRNMFSKINELLSMFPAVAIVGARQCGKTTLAKALRPDWLYMDLEKPSDFNRIQLDPEFFLQQNPGDIIFDEAQLSPTLFEEIRVYDNRNEKTSFIIIDAQSVKVTIHRLLKWSSWKDLQKSTT